MAARVIEDSRGDGPSIGDRTKEQPGSKVGTRKKVVAEVVEAVEYPRTRLHYDKTKIRKETRSFEQRCV